VCLFVDGVVCVKPIYNNNLTCTLCLCTKHNAFVIKKKTFGCKEIKIELTEMLKKIHPSATMAKQLS
jgi:hypothetical protein